MSTVKSPYDGPSINQLDLMLSHHSVIQNELIERRDTLNKMIESWSIVINKLRLEREEAERGRP